VILFPYSGDTRGGSVHSSFLLIETLLERGLPLKLAFHGEGFTRDLARKRGLPFVDLPPLGSRAEMGRKDGFRPGNITALAACRRAIAETGATIVHVNDKRMLRTWCLPVRLSRAALIAHWRSVYSPSWSVDLGLRIASRIVCVSTYSRELLPGWARIKSSVVYNPFKPIIAPEARAEARQRLRSQAGIPEDAAVIGFFGALLQRKQPHVLLEVLKRIPQTADGRPVVGVLCGEALAPRDEKFFALMAGWKEPRRVVQAGFVDNVGEWMAASDVMIAPAYDEPLARVGVEAQSAGLPAIVSSDGGLREVVEDGVTGLVVDPHDLDGWVAATRRVLDDAELAARLRAGGLAAAAKLTPDRHADQIEALYDGLRTERAA
jgi:glycosyltransferase involved in cell wall biosynthesis